jgi:hypothetical protein
MKFFFQILLLISCPFLLKGQDCIHDCVWPGDANQDGMVDYIDLVYMYRAQDWLGQARLNMDTDWSPKEALDWGFEFPLSQVNGKHSDSNGDGLIDIEDNLIVFHNLYQTNDNFIQSSGNFIEGDDLQFVFSQDTLNLGDTLTIEVHLGTAANPVQDVSGLSFVMSLDTSVFQESTLLIPFTTEAWLGGFSNSKSAIKYDLQNPIFPNDEIGFAFGRTDGMTANGFGKIFEFSIVIEDNIAGLIDNEQIQTSFEFRNVLGINPYEVDLQLTAQNAEVIVGSLRAAPILNNFANYISPCIDYNAPNFTAERFDLNTQTWENHQRVSIIHTDLGKIEKKTLEYFNGNTWIPVEREHYFYEDLELKEIVYSKWNPTLIDWENQIQEQYIYDNQISMIFRNVWHNDSWIAYQIDDYNYTSNQLSNIFISQWSEGQGEWSNVYLKEFDIQIPQMWTQKSIWDDLQNNWLPLTKDTLIYESNSSVLAIQVQHIWNAEIEEWFLHWEDDFLDAETRSYWNTGQETLDVAFQNIYSGNANSEECIREFRFGSAWENLFRWYTVSVANEEIQQQKLDCQYPNPFPNGSTFSCKDLAENATIYIYNTQGQILQSHSMKSYQQDLTLNLPTGLYLVIITNSKGIIGQEKLVVIR